MHGTGSNSMVVPPKKILFATDFGPNAARISRVVVRLSQVFHTEVALLHVLKVWPPIRELEKLAKQRLHQLTDELVEQGVPVVNEWIAIGSAAGEIFNRARTWDADLVLIGAGKITETSRFSPGVVAETVLEMAPQPVLAVHPNPQQEEINTIICPVDQSATSGRGLSAAINMARGCRARLIVFTVVPETSWITAVAGTGDLFSPMRQYQEAWRQEFEKFLTSFDFTGVRWEAVVREGMPHRETVTLAKDSQADLICMASTGRTGLGRVLMGSVARRVLQELPTSLLLVKEEELIRAALIDDRAPG
jgi:nucleotide-binding universal stress UspA family protein